MAANAVHTPQALIPGRARFYGFFLRQQFGQCLLRANVMRLHPIQLLLGLNAGGDGHQAVKATRIVAAVVVLGAVVHKFPDGLQTPFDRMRSQISSS